jgi:hypothetical protein
MGTAKYRQSFLLKMWMAVAGYAVETEAHNYFLNSPTRYNIKCEGTKQNLCNSVYFT